jgi:hypothetical protein
MTAHDGESGGHLTEIVHVDRERATDRPVHASRSTHRIRRPHPKNPIGHPSLSHRDHLDTSPDSRDRAPRNEE